MCREFERKQLSYKISGVLRDPEKKKSVFLEWKQIVPGGGWKTCKPIWFSICYFTVMKATTQHKNIVMPKKIRCRSAKYGFFKYREKNM